MKPFSGRLPWILLLAIALAALAAGRFWPAPTAPGETAGVADGHRILPAAAAPAGGPIDLPVSSLGHPFRLEDYRGRFLWVYFGYTACPDACPSSMFHLSTALSRLPEALRGEVVGLFVSVDPERDAEDHLRRYVSHFHPELIAATGDHAQLAGIAARYGVFYRAAPLDSALGYAVDHTSATYLLGPDGALLEIHPHGTGARELIDALLRHHEQLSPKAG
jgi:protein SCO1